MSTKNKFGIEEQSNTEKLAMEIYIYKEENKNIKDIISDAINLIKEECFKNDQIVCSLSISKVKKLYTILHRNLKNPSETIREVK